MSFERVHMVWDFYDGVRSGIADYRGAPNHFDCAFDGDKDEYSDVYRLWPVDSELLDLATEQWHRYTAWERRVHSGEVSRETHPGHRGQDPRYDELEDRIDHRLKALGAPVSRALATFRACSDAPELPAGNLRELEVEWVDVR